jgi:integrase
MPLKLVPPRQGWSPNWRVRGTYLGVRVDRSAKTPKRTVAARALKEIESEIERGRLVGGTEKTFADAALAYLKGGGEKRYVAPLLEHFAETPIAEIDQAAVDAAASDLYPPGISEKPSPHNATINRQVHTPVSAILAAGGFPRRFRRPKQPDPKARWISPEQAAEFLDRAAPKLRRLATFLLNGGCRVTEACNIRGEDWHPGQTMAYVRDTKTGEARAVHLTPAVLTECAQLKPKSADRVFGYKNRWEVYRDWNRAKEAAASPVWFTPHKCCHTWATWMRQYAGLDLRGLLGTGRWKDLKSVLRYQHVDTSAEMRAADRLPNVQNPCKKSRKRKKSVA